jgi:DNA invertase Pin-like site-specific DNA recombinase
MFHLLAGFAEFEWSIRKERQAEGIEKALQKGVRFGRPHKLTKALIQQIHMQRAQGMTIAELKAYHHLGKTTLYRALGVTDALNI